MGTLTAFGKVAPYLTHPLTLVGYVLLLFFGIHRVLIRSGIIPPLSARTGGKIVQILLRYGVIIAVLVILIGFALEFRKSALTGGITIGVTLEQLSRSSNTKKDSSERKWKSERNWKNWPLMRFKGAFC